MRILRVDAEPFHELPYAAPRGRGGLLPLSLPFLRAAIDRLPVGITALVASADLQGFERDVLEGRPRRLLGEMVAEELEVLSGLGILAPPRETVVLLCGDMHAKEAKRGGYGDVRDVWSAFAQRSAFVAGVAGNHDAFGASPAEAEEFRRGRGVHFLDGDLTEASGLRVAGISGVVGNPRRPFRREEGDFAGIVSKLAARRPDILLMHDGPDAPGVSAKGNPAVRAALEKGPPALVIRGHAYWRTPLVELATGTQVLNVDSRVVVMTTERKR